MKHSGTASTLSLSLSLSLSLVLVLGACDGSAPSSPSGPSGTGGASVVIGAGGALGPAGSGGAAAQGAGGASAGTGGGGHALGGSPGAGGAAGAAGQTGSAGGTGGAPRDAGGGTDVNQAALPSVTLHIAGDSTVMTYLQPTATADEGWGQELAQYFISRVAIDNQAIGGASVLSFHDSSRWTNIINAIKPGDYVMAAFGANDSGSVAGRHVDPPAFQALFEQMADDVKAKQGTFIPVTPSALREFTGVREGNVRLGPYAAATIAAGMAKTLLVDDLNARSVELLDKIGPSGAMLLYKGVDKAHFTKAGAVQMALFVAQELRRIGSPLGAYLK